MKEGKKRDEGRREARLRRRLEKVEREDRIKLGGEERKIEVIEMRKVFRRGGKGRRKVKLKRGKRRYNEGKEEFVREVFL